MNLENYLKIDMTKDEYKTVMEFAQILSNNCNDQDDCKNCFMYVWCNKYIGRSGHAFEEILDFLINDNWIKIKEKSYWIKLNDDQSCYQCSNCKDISCCQGNYCPDCGAEMEINENE